MLISIHNDVTGQRAAWRAECIAAVDYEGSAMQVMPVEDPLDCTVTYRFATEQKAFEAYTKFVNQWERALKPEKRLTEAGGAA